MVESAGEKGQTYFFVMRHGERADFVEESSANAPPYNPNIEHDPPLTAKGLGQAKKAGEYFNQRI